MTAEYQREWRRRNLAKRLEYERAYHQKNKLKLESYVKEWNKKNPDKVKEYRLKHEDLESVKKYRKAYSAAWRKLHLDEQRIKGRIYYENNKQKFIDRATEQVYRKRALLNGVEREKYTKAEIYDRDNGKCGICFEAIYLELKFPNPFSFSFHHVNPISLGGNDKAENIAATHLRCNQGLGNRVMA